jgi:flagellar biosynthesis protein FliP
MRVKRVPTARKARLLAAATAGLALVLLPGTALAQAPQNPGQVSVDFGNIGSDQKPTQSVLIILALTVLSVAPSLLIMLTSFTRIVIVLSITRNALGLPTIPPNQVVVGLALFLSLFIMSPTLDAVNSKALQPFLKGDISSSEAFTAAQAPLKQFMLKQTRQAELEVFIKASGKPRPKDLNAIDLTTLAPAFILSELRTSFIMGFVIFIPFLVIDLLISSTLMSMGLMMLPPVLVSLPFKLLLFVMVDGWGLVVRSLVDSFR